MSICFWSLMFISFSSSMSFLLSLMISSDLSMSCCFIVDSFSSVFSSLLLLINSGFNMFISSTCTSFFSSSCLSVSVPSSTFKLLDLSKTSSFVSFFKSSFVLLFFVISFSLFSLIFNKFISFSKSS